MGEDARELAEVDPIVVAVGKEGVHDALAQRIDRQLGNAQEVFPRKRPAVVAIQRGEAGVQPLYLVWCNCGWGRKI